MYAVAAVTYRLVAGRPPFGVDGGIAAVLGRTPEAVPEPVARALGAPRDLDDLLRECLSFDPDRRPRSALDVADRLDVFRGRVLDAGGDTSWDDDAVGSRSRHLVGRPLLAAVGGVTFFAVALATWLVLQLR